MGYSNQVVIRARKRLEQAKELHAHETQARISELYEKYPRLQEIDCLLRQTMAKVIAETFHSTGSPEAGVAAARKENQALQQERQWILESESIDPSDLVNSPICATCSGTGYVGATMCECLKELCRQEQKKELSSLFSTNREGFDNFKLDYYSNQVDPKIGCAPRDFMGVVLERCKQYAANFSQKSGSLLFYGGTGLGKTMLSAAIAKVVADRGFSVCYQTAGKVFSDFEAEKFGGAQGITTKYLACDLLILDDLATEMSTQFTHSALYTLVNGRMMANLPTIISTNLSTGEIEQRYTPQIASRLLGFYTLTRFVGDDIRRK